MQNLPKLTFSQAMKSPPVYIMMVAISIAWFFVYQFANTSSQVNKNCESENQRLRIELTNKSRQMDDLTTALLVKNGIINEIKKATDSAAKKSFADEAKNIIQK
ncbi:hypothetical protein ACJVDH_00460 [Pedobacter sp. AW1-32]|uniref:hypothetical protein n=1 Tax=Pedobacter sp. AW1-32 TaxID=3383026 RepID=UPI003FEF64B3